MNNAIGILGGTFDPIHFGHLRPALDVAEDLGLDHIRLIPSAMPPHRAQPVATPEQRLTMLELAAKNNEWLIVDNRELHRQGPSYTVDTLQSLRQDFPENPLYFLVGTDAFLGIQRWQQWQQLLTLAHIVVMQRPKEVLAMTDDLNNWYQRHLASDGDGDGELLSGKIWPIEVTQLEISATEIRSIIAEGLNPQFLLPEAVIKLIEIMGLYRDRQ